MNYFIDFEATQFSGEIISMGCIDENGRQFYTLIRPGKMEEITGFITDLTGIDRNALEKAPSADEAFTIFLYWLNHDQTAKFYCYGDSDAYFLDRTLEHLSKFNAQLGLCIIRGALTDYAAVIKKHFSLRNSIALKKVVSYYRGEIIEQDHNSLDDAMLLKEVFEHAENETVEGCPFPEYTVSSAKPKIQKRITAFKGNVHMEFPSFAKAADWVITEQLSIRDVVNEKTKSKICSRIICAAEKKRPYCGYDWKINYNS